MLCWSIPENIYANLTNTVSKASIDSVTRYPVEVLHIEQLLDRYGGRWKHENVWKKRTWRIPCHPFTELNKYSTMDVAALVDQKWMQYSAWSIRIFFIYDAAHMIQFDLTACQDIISLTVASQVGRRLAREIWSTSRLSGREIWALLEWVKTWWDDWGEVKKWQKWGMKLGKCLI